VPPPVLHALQELDLIFYEKILTKATCMADLRHCFTEET
jgi:hypothetical protein